MLRQLQRFINIEKTNQITANSQTTGTAHTLAQQAPTKSIPLIHNRLLTASSEFENKSHKRDPVYHTVETPLSCAEVQDAPF